jgi:hypothetical protein
LTADSIPAQAAATIAAKTPDNLPAIEAHPFPAPLFAEESLDPVVPRGVAASFTPAVSELPTEAVLATLTDQEKNQTTGAPVISHEPNSRPLMGTGSATAVPEQAAVGGAATTAARPDNSQIMTNFAQLPLSFEANHGQTDPKVQFLAHAPGYSVLLSGGEAVFSLSTPTLSDSLAPASATNAVVAMQVVGATPAATATGQEELPGKVNYFLGNDPKHWYTDISTYARVEYADIYPGINLVYYGNHQQLEYDFVVAPGANPSAITLSFTGTQQVQIDDQGELVLATGMGPIRQHKPVLYQPSGLGIRQEVPGSFVTKGNGQVGFKVGAYDPDRPLVIDPVLYSTYLGGSGDDMGNAIAVDQANNVYITGQTSSIDLPTLNPLPAQASLNGRTDAFVTKLNSTGTGLVYSTYLGGTTNPADNLSDSRGNGIALDSDNNIYVTGRTDSTDFPTTAAAAQPGFGGGADTYDAFVTKLNAAGSGLIYSTYLGGSGTDAAYAIAVDSNRNVYVAGGTNSRDLIGGDTPSYSSNGNGPDAFLAKLSPSGTTLLYATYFGGSGGMEHANGLAVDDNGHAYIAGQITSPDMPTRNAAQAMHGGGLYDAFVAEFNTNTTMPNDDTSLIYATYFGGSRDDKAYDIKIDALGNAYITGVTKSTDFPTMNALQPLYGGGANNAFVAKFNAAGALVYSSYLGGSGNDSGLRLALGPSNTVYITGQTNSTDFPTRNAFQPALGGGFDAFVTKLDLSVPAAPVLVYSSYLGGSGDENVGISASNSGAIAVDSLGNAYVTGRTASADFRTVNPLPGQDMLHGQSNAFVAKIG